MGVLKDFPTQSKSIDIEWDAVRRSPLGDFFVCGHSLTEDGCEFEEYRLLRWTTEVSFYRMLESLNVI